MYKHHYSEFLKANAGKLHMACHSHHYWPDVTRQAMLDYWEDSAQMVDDKWNYFFSEKIPKVQKLIAENLNLSNPQSLVFAPNTHELLYRLISSFYGDKPVKILTTSSEFHSFNRQSRRWQEMNLATVDRVAVNSEFEDQFVKKALEGDYDLIFFSHVFFDSGIALENLERLVNKLSSTESTIVVDGYHGFGAIPTDLSRVEENIFYLGGSYKYLQGGEGCCFMHVPPNSLKPVNTGWFAGFAELESKQDGPISFSEGAMKFAGSTMDFSALYRLEASLKLINEITIETIHQYIQNLQNVFLEKIYALENSYLNKDSLMVNDLGNHGHFLTFKTEHAAALHDYLKSHGVITDFRGDRLRFGFAIYHDPQDYQLDFLSQFRPEV